VGERFKMFAHVGFFFEILAMRQGVPAPRVTSDREVCDEPLMGILLCNVTDFVLKE
jgi:hypothetical protein